MLTTLREKLTILYPSCSLFGLIKQEVPTKDTLDRQIFRNESLKDRYLLVLHFNLDKASKRCSLPPNFDKNLFKNAYKKRIYFAKKISYQPF